MANFPNAIFRSMTLIVAALSIVGLPAAAPVAASVQEKAAVPKPAAGKAKLAAIKVEAPDAFYDPPADIPARPGALLRSEPLKGVTLPAGLRGWKILYTTTIDDNLPATAVATVFAPTTPRPGPRPVIMWEHGTTGLMQKCMPSLITAPTMGIPALPQIVKAGWVVVATDYAFPERNGPHPYLIGEGEARSGLDSVRAARQMTELKLDDRTVVWGHSQGGGSALWTGIIGPRYAPDVKIEGVAAIAPAADMTILLKMNPNVDRRLGPFVAAAYSRYYPDIKFEQAIRPEALAAARQMVGLCGFLPQSDPQKTAALMKTFVGPALATATNKALQERLAQNAANQPIAAPLLIAQGSTDVVVLPAATTAYVKARCAAGQRLAFWTIKGRDHGGIVQPDSQLAGPLAIWTAARFAGAPQPGGCSTRSF